MLKLPTELNTWVGFLAKLYIGALAAFPLYWTQSSMDNSPWRVSGHVKRVSYRSASYRPRFIMLFSFIPWYGVESHDTPDNPGSIVNNFAVVLVVPPYRLKPAMARLGCSSQMESLLPYEDHN